MADTYTTASSLTIKEVISKVLALSRIEAEQHHNQIQNELNTLKNGSSITFGEVAGNFDNDLITDFAADNDTTNISTFTTVTPLTYKQALSLSLEIAQFKAKKDHDDIRAFLYASNNFSNVSDEWIKDQFSSDVVQIYVDTYEENFKVKPEKLLTLLQADQTLGSTFDDYTAALTGNVIYLTKAEADTYTFTVASDGLTATGEISGVSYIVDYKAETVTQVE